VSDPEVVVVVEVVEVVEVEVERRPEANIPEPEQRSP